MSTRSLTLFLPAAIALFCLAVACTDADSDSVGVVGVTVAGSAMDSDPNPEVRAAASAADLVQHQQAAAQLSQGAIGPRGELDFTKIDQALELTPIDRGLRLKKSAMAVAAGRDSEQLLVEARFTAHLHPSWANPTADRATVSIYVVSLEGAIAVY